MTFDFNNWRDNYDNYSFEDQKQAYSEFEQEFPEQRCYDTGGIGVLLTFISVFKFNNKPLRIVEIGGWKGDLANEIFSTSDGIVEVWDNYEICTEAVEKSVCSHEKYRAIELFEHPWAFNFYFRYDVGILSHIIEHVRERDLRQLIARLSDPTKYLLIDAPIPADSTNLKWTDYKGTHILEIGWKQVDNILHEYGYARIGATQTTGSSVLCAYEKMGVTQIGR